MKVIRHFQWVGHLHRWAQNYLKIQKGAILICGGVGHFFDCSVDLSDTKQGQTDLMSNSTSKAAIRWRWYTVDLLFCDLSDHSNCVFSRGLKNTQSRNLQRKRDRQICRCDLSAHCLLCFSGHNLIPSLVCKSAPSSGKGSGSSKFNLPALSFILSDQILSYFSNQLLKPHVACCSGHIKNTVVNSCPGIV